MDRSGPIDPETWARVNDLFHRALEQDPSDRSAFLDIACAGEPHIRAEVESLLGAHEDAGEFIERPAGSVAGLLAQAGSGRAPLPDEIGHYRVLRLLGEGGMGVVYLAEDTRLGRTVALKSLAPRLVGNTASRERLRREARAAASLNHPGIATVYALEEIDDRLFIAGEYVPGETLRDELERGPLTPLRAIDTTIQIAKALTVAHQRGIVHRDLKPENVIRTPSGEVKILDFGLARFRDWSPEAMALSADGAVLGTPAYMSPEQVRATPVDARSDLFSLGIMLYEFLTGLHPFMGSDPASTIARVLEAEPPRLVEFLPGNVPAAAVGPLEHIVITCLRKPADARFPSASELLAALEEVRTALTTSSSGVQWARTTKTPMPATGGWTPTPLPAASTPAPPAARWWWQFHQVATVVVYSLLLVPLWFVRSEVTRPYGTFLFLAGLIGVITASALRLHLWFAAQLDPAGWREQHQVSGRWRRTGDVLFVLGLVAAGTTMIVRDPAADDPSWIGIVLVAAAAAVTISFAIIEPTTARAAFGEDAGQVRS